MGSAAKPAPIASHVAEVLEVAWSILRRHHDDEIARKAFVLQECVALYKSSPELDREMLDKALADLTCAVHLHLNTELAAVANAFERLSQTSSEDRPSRSPLPGNPIRIVR